MQHETDYLIQVRRDASDSKGETMTTRDLTDTHCEHADLLSSNAQSKDRMRKLLAQEEDIGAHLETHTSF